MNEPLSTYLALAYPFSVVAEDDGGYFIQFPDLPGCMTQVEEAAEIGPMADEIRRLWLESAVAAGVRVPLPSGISDYSGKFMVRLPRSLHRRLAEGAAREGVSLNAWVTTLLARADALALATSGGAGDGMLPQAGAADPEPVPVPVRTAAGPEGPMSGSVMPAIVARQLPGR